MFEASLKVLKKIESHGYKAYIAGDTCLRLDKAGERLLDFVLSVADGSRTKTEYRGAREISIFKDGVVL